MRLLDLFSGIGGFSLGLERAGFRTVAFCEIEPYPRAVLAKHWPGVPIYEDIRTLSADVLERDGIAVDAICGGFPCQDLSYAGKRAGIEGARSGLWSEYARLIGEIRPRIAIMENVPGLLSAGHGRVLGDLAALGYDAVWDCIPASAVGAPHRRDRVWIVAHANKHGKSVGTVNAEARWMPAVVADASRKRVEGDGACRQQEPCSQTEEGLLGRDGFAVPNTTGAERAGQRPITGREQSRFADRCRREPERGLGGVANGLPDWVDASAWLEEPEGVPRVIKGQEHRAHRLKGLGNAVVPQVVEAIGRAVMEGLNAA
jgi:DNA (cytosine-5)-methyltransferase 1